MPPWSNLLARSAVKRKVGGSSQPGGDDTFSLHSFCESNNGGKQIILVFNWNFVFRKDYKSPFLFLYIITVKGFGSNEGTNEQYNTQNLKQKESQVNLNLGNVMEEIT